MADTETPTAEKPAPTPAESKVLQKCQDAAMAGGWVHPFFLVPLAHATWEVTKAVKTMDVDSDLKIRVNPEFVERTPPRTLAGCIFHEVLHPMLGHTGRQGSRDQKKWDIASDMVINTMLAKLGFDLPKGVYYCPAGHEEEAAEDVYEVVKPEDENKQDPGNVGQGCGMAQGQNPGQGDGEGEGDGQGQGNGQGQGDSEKDSQFWGEMMAQAMQAEAATHSRGSDPFKALARLFEAPENRVGWRQLLRATVNRVAAGGGRDMTSASRRNRRSPPGIILPGWISHKPRVAVVIDTSGSMSDKMVEQAVGEAAAIGEVTGSDVFVALHDAQCYWSGWVRGAKDAQLAKRIVGRGGTCAREAYQKVAEQRGRFDAMIHLTDGEISWPETPGNARRLIIGLIGESRYAEEHLPEGRCQLVKVEMGD